MRLLSDFVMTLLKAWKIEDLPVNVLIGDKYYDIDEFFFDSEIHEYILKLSGGIDYNTRSDIFKHKPNERSII